MKIIKIIGILAAVAIVAVAVAGMYKFNYLSGKSGYDVDGNKIKKEQVGLANPASTFCIEQGGTPEIKDIPEGQIGYCNLPDGTVIEEWEFYNKFSRLGKGNSVSEIFKVGPQKEKCTGMMPMECLIVNGEFFYDTIEGFDFEKGYSYELEVEKTQYCDPGVFNDCPQDVSIYNYKLIKVLKKEKAENQELVKNDNFIKNCQKENGVVLGPNKSLQCAKNGKISFADKRASIDISSCESYDDGCNTCFVKDGKIGGCTLMYCEEELQKPGCIK